MGRTASWPVGLIPEEATLTFVNCACTVVETPSDSARKLSPSTKTIRLTIMHSKIFVFDLVAAQLDVDIALAFSFAPHLVVFLAAPTQS